MNYPTIALALSIAALPITVKAQGRNLPSFKKDGTKHESGFKDSVKDVKIDFSKLIQTLMASGEDGNFPDGFAQAVGLSQPMPDKDVHREIGHHGDKEDSRECNVLYGSDETSGRHTVCVLLSRTKRTKGEMSSKYYRVNLDGQLEGAVTLNMKRGPDGNAIPEGRSRSDDDINSPEVQKAFKAEMTYWLKVWLKKHQRLVAISAKRAKTDSVKASAAKETKALDHEAATAPAASAPAPTAP